MSTTWAGGKAALQSLPASTARNGGGAPFAADEAVNSAGEVGERLQESAAFELLAVENRRKVHDFGVVIGANSLDEAVDSARVSSNSAPRP